MRKLKDRPCALIWPGGTSLTEQQHKNDCDINIIMARALRGESNDYIREHDGYFGDATSVEYMDACLVVANANSSFENLPSKIRNRFDNDAAKFLEFVKDPKNQDEMIELGLAKRKPAPETPPSQLPPVQPASVKPAQNTPAPAAPKPEPTPPPEA